MSLKHFLVSVLAIILAALLAPALGASVQFTVVGALVLAVVLALINMFIKPVISILTLPVNILTLGLFSIVVNTLLILLAAKLTPQFEFGGFWSALIFSLVLSLINILFRA